MANPQVFGIVLAGGEGKRLAPLTADRAKPAVPFGGNYRLIDFALSNLVNGGFLQIVVLTQYKSHSLDRHVATTWRLSPLLGNYVTPVPAQMRARPALVRGLGRRDLPEPEPDLRRAAGLRLRVRRRPHLPHGSAADGRAAHRDGRGRHGRRACACRSTRRGQFGVIEPGPTAVASARSARSRATPSGCPTRPTRCSRRWATTSSRPRR